MKELQSADKKEEVIKEILLNTIYPIKNTEILPDTELFKIGLDSINSINFALAIEKHYGITFDDEHMLGENFATIASIIDLLDKYHV